MISQSGYGRCDSLATRRTGSAKMTLTDIINVLERKYPYAFVYSIKNLKNDRFSFRFKDNAPLEEVMEIIVNVVGQMDYRIVEDKCYLTRI